MHTFPTASTFTAMRSPLSVSAQRRAYNEDPQWPVKAFLRLGAIGIALIAMSLFAASISYMDAHFAATAGPSGDWTDGLALAPVFFALLYNTGALLAHLALRRGRPLHPAIHLAGDLVTWALALPGIVVAIAGGIFWYWTDPLPSAGGDVDCGFFFNAFTMQCNPVVYTIGRMEIVGTVFLVVILYVLPSLPWCS